MEDKVAELKNIDGVPVEELLAEDLEIITACAQVVAEVIASSPFPSVDPDMYFIWMYSVEPFAEA